MSVRRMPIDPLPYLRLTDMSRQHNPMSEDQMWGIRNAAGMAAEVGTLSPEWYLTVEYLAHQWHRKLEYSRHNEIQHSLICDAAHMFSEHPEKAQELWQELCAVPIPNTGSWYDRMSKMGMAYRQLHPEDYDDEELEV
jgi:hypothetical protein